MTMEHVITNYTNRFTMTEISISVESVRLNEL